MIFSKNAIHRASVGRALLSGAIAMLGICFFSSHLRAQTTPSNDFITSGLSEQGDLHLTVNKSVIITTGRPQKRVSVSEPSIVDVNGISPTRILLTAKKAGTTQVIVWDDQDRSQTIDVSVEPDISGLRMQFSKFTNAQIEASSANDTVVLRGHVPSLAVAQQAEQLAAGYGKSVANLLEVAGGQQVMLQVRVAEVSKTAIRQLGVNLGYSDGRSFAGVNIGGTNNFGIRQLASNADSSGLSITSTPAASIFGTVSTGDSVFSYFVDALRQNNVLRILAEPNLVAISGQEASFLAGGEFPIPVPQTGDSGSTTITIQYREFGVKLNFTPIVLGNGMIRLKVSPEVSDLDFTTAVRFGGFVVPGLSTRKLTTTVELGDSQTYAVAGLLNQSVSADRSNVPFLGDIPLIGSLFRSVRYQRKETELVVFVTPKIVSPMSPDQLPPLPGEAWRHPSDTELFSNGDMGGAIAGQREGPARKYVGSYGFSSPATQPSMR